MSYGSGRPVIYGYETTFQCDFDRRSQGDRPILIERGGQISGTTNEELSSREIVFLGYFIQQRGSYIGTSSSKELDIEEQLRVEFYCIVCPRPIASNPDRSFINHNL